MKRILAHSNLSYMSFDLVPNCVTANGVAHSVQAEMGPDGCDGVRLPRSPDEHGDVRSDGRGVVVVVDVVGPTDHLDGQEPGREDRPPLRHRLLLRHRQSQPHSLRGVRGRRSECIQPTPVDIPKKQNHQTNQPQHCHRSVKIRRNV